MKRKLISIALVVGVFAGTLMLSAKAEEASFFINKNGVKIDNKVVAKFKDQLGIDYFNTVSADEYTILNNLSETGYKEETIVNVEKQLVENGKVLETQNYNLTEEEYATESMISPMTTCTDYSAQACWQTNAKRLTLWIGVNYVNNYISAYVNNEWLTVPNVKEADVIALRFTGVVRTNIVSGTQHYVRTSTGQGGVIDYPSDNGNVQKFSNGVGISMNLVDDAKEHRSFMAWGGYFDNINDVTIYASYQHATSYVSVADSKKYNLSASGLGGVINFTNSTIKSKYDGMTGVSFHAANV